MITKELLVAAGYRGHQDTARIKQYVDGFYQKRVRDESGTKYFIQFWHYPMAIVNQHNEPFPESWLFELDINEPHSTFEIHRPTDISFCEGKAEEFWRMMGAVYYERNEP